MTSSNPGDPANPIAGYEDWPAAVRSAEPYRGLDDATNGLARVLGLRRPAGAARLRVERRWTRADVAIQQLRWSVGYGPETQGWLLRPAGEAGMLPGVLGLHSHGGVRSVGGEQLVDLGADSSPRAVQLRTAYYEDRAPANDLARRGHVVLVHDAFSWGSRRFDLSHPTPQLASRMEAQEALWREQGLAPTLGRTLRCGVRLS